MERPLTGRGIKSFRETCKERVHLPNRICSTHQHNYHLQILNDTGLIGYLIFFGTFFFVILKCFRKNNLRSNIYFYAALSVLIIELNMIKQQWKPYANLEINVPGFNKIIAWGRKKHDSK